jgi:hypothetical protein
LVPTTEEEVASTLRRGACEETPPLPAEENIRVLALLKIHRRQDLSTISNRLNGLDGAEGPHPISGGYISTHVRVRTQEYPAGVFPLARTNANKDRFPGVKGWSGRPIFSQYPWGTTLPAYRQSRTAERYADASFDYTPQRRNWFVLSGTVRDEMFYEHVTLSCDHRSIHGWVLVYPRAERAFYDAIGAEIRASYRDANARCSDLKS